MDSALPTQFVIVATYNERDNIGDLLEGVAQHLPAAIVLVVDDNSPDGTAAVVDGCARSGARVMLIRRPAKLGYASAHLEGIRFALEQGADAIITMDADLSHDPSALPAIVAALDSHDVVIGSRYVEGGRIVGWPVLRHVMSRGANLAARLFAGLPARDCTSGYRGYRAALLRRVPLESLRARGYAFGPEILFWCIRSGARIAEVPITFLDRARGRSKMSVSIILEAIWVDLRLFARRLWRGAG